MNWRNDFRKSWASTTTDTASHLALLGQVQASARALDLGQVQSARQGLVEASRRLADRARWLEGDLQRRHQELADRFMCQALRLQASAAAVAATFAGQGSRACSGVGGPTANPVGPASRVSAAGRPDPGKPAITPAVSSSPLSPTDPDAGPANMNEIVGADHIRQLFRHRFINPLSDPARAALYKQRCTGGVLLYGPPGTGKTFIVRALARELAIPVFNISPTEILSRWFGESEKQLADLFTRARQHPAALIFVDEIDALAPDRDSLGDNGGPLQRMLTQLLAELDGFSRPGGCLLFVGATNRPWALDSALLRPGRLDAIAYLGLPSRATRAALLRNHLQGVPQRTDIDWAVAAAQLSGCSSAETVACASAAARMAFADAVRNGRNRPVNQADLIAAARSVGRAATPALLSRHRAFANDRGLPPAFDYDAADSDAGAGCGTAVVQGPDGALPNSQAFEPFGFVKARDLSIEVESLPFVCYALQHAGIAPVRQITVTNAGAEESQNLLVEVALVPDEYGEPWHTNIAELPSGGRWQSGPVNLPLSLDRLRAVVEKEGAHLRISIRDKDEVLLARTVTMPVLAYNEWIYLPQFLTLAAAYVQPNSPALLPVVRAASLRLKAAIGSTAFQGYQAGNRVRVGNMLVAIHDTLANEIEIAYINPPASFEHSGQKIRLVADTLQQGRGTCLDLAILQAALWEHIGLYPLLVLVPGHALVACWTDERISPEPVITLKRDATSASAAAIEEAINAGALRIFNSVEVASGKQLREAEKNGHNILRQVLNQGEEVKFIDIRASRARVTPLP